MAAGLQFVEMATVPLSAESSEADRFYDFQYMLTGGGNF